MNITQLKQHVTHFSASLRLDCSHGQEVVVGGRVTHILPPLSESYPKVMVQIEDYLGQLCIFVPEALLDSQEKAVHVGDFFIFEGYVNVIHRIIQNEPIKDITIFAFDMKDITSNGDTNK